MRMRMRIRKQTKKGKEMKGRESEQKIRQRRKQDRRTFREK